jgi:hypothetical protein
LMRSRLVAVGDITIEHAVELPLIEDQQMVETFLPHTPGEALADRIGSRSVIGCFEDLDAAGCGHARKAVPKFAIVITNQILWRLSIWRSFSELLGNPRIGRRSCYAYVDYSPRLEFDNEERKERSKEEIRDL